MTRASILALAALAATLTAGQSAEPTVVSGGDTTLVYVFPTSPQTFVPIQGLPSFLAMPGADLPAIATQVVYTVPQPSLGVRTGGVADLDCRNFVGTVTISGPDTYGLDKDGDGIGCEPEDRT
jgi:hypothetical protein